MKARVLAMALAVTMLIGVVLLRGGVSDRMPKPDAAEARKEGTVTVTRRHSPDVVLAIKPGVASSSRTAPLVPKVSPLMEQYNGKRDWKGIYERGSKSPSATPEERYLAAQIADDCRHRPGLDAATVDKEFAASRERVLQGISPKDPMRDKRIAATDTMFRRTGACRELHELRITREEARALMVKAAEAGDPRARARLVELDMWAPILGPDGNLRFGVPGAPMMPSMSEAQLATVRESLASGDPTVITIAGRILSNSIADLQIRAGPDEATVDLRVFRDAWMLAACDAGRDCGPGHEHMVSGCMSFGNCEARDLREYYFFYDHSPQMSQRVAEYHARISSAIRTGDWSWFRFHRGPNSAGMVYGIPP